MSIVYAPYVSLVALASCCRAQCVSQVYTDLRVYLLVLRYDANSGNAHAGREGGGAGREDVPAVLGGRRRRPARAAVCACRGSQKWIHRHCLEKWRRTSPKEDAAYRCGQCKDHYRDALSLELLRARLQAERARMVRALPSP